MIDFSELLSQGDANDMMQEHTIHTPGGEDISFSELCKRAGIESPPLFDDMPSVIPADDAADPDFISFPSEIYCERYYAWIGEGVVNAECEQ